MSFETFESKFESKQPAGEALINQLNDSKVENIFDRNHETIMKFKENIVDHFSTIMERLPMEDQLKVIAGFPEKLDKDDIVYQGMKERFEARMES